MTDKNHFDAIIVGSGAGGCAAAYTLARAGLCVALIEKGRELPRDGSTLDFHRVVEQGSFKSREPWQDAGGRQFCPEEYFNVGGKTKWYGAALLRYGRHEFSADPTHPCPGWPIGYDELVPFYEQAERMLGVRQFDCEPNLRHIAESLMHHSPSWNYEPLPMGLSARILYNPGEARHFDGFASAAHLKSDAETTFLAPVRALPNLALLTDRVVAELVGSESDATLIEAVRLQDGSLLHGRVILLAAGALHSPRLLQNYIETRGLTAILPCADNVGRYLKCHLLTAMIAISTPRMTDLVRKTLIFYNADMSHSSVQPLGFDGELISTLIPKFVPRTMAGLVGNHAYGFFLQTEDGAHRDNRVIAASQGHGGLPVYDYDARRTPVAEAEHHELVSRFRGALARAGLIAFAERIGIAGTAHVSGTLCTGTDPKASVVDSEGLVHGMKSLYVVDGSILPRSSRVNPSLTIYAWALRVASELAARLSTGAVATA
jgi:choline dehydrogenase-like flavoprotein